MGRSLHGIRFGSNHVHCLGNWVSGSLEPCILHAKISLSCFMQIADGLSCGLDTSCYSSFLNLQRIFIESFLRQQ